MTNIVQNLHKAEYAQPKTSQPEKGLWWHAEKGKVYSQVLDQVQGIDRVQSKIFDKFIKLACMYDPQSMVRGDAPDSISGEVTENVIASNVDTVAAVISATGVRARFMTDDADWSEQRRARQLELYIDGLDKLLSLQAKCRTAFKAAALKGTGLLKVYTDSFNNIKVEPIMVDDIVVDEVESRNGAPMQLHMRIPMDREVLKSQFPGNDKVIDAAQLSMAARNWRWAGYRPVRRNECMVIESWRLPIGTKGKEGYRIGRHVITIDGADLLDEEYEREFFPFARIVWSEPIQGWYGISLAERIAGTQRELNRRNWQINRSLDQAASPTTYVGMADANLAVKSTNRIGNIAVVKGNTPVTVAAPIVNPETYQSARDLKASAFEESGVSRMAAQAAKPAGIDSGVAMREYRDQTTQRFAIQEAAFERLYLDVVLLVVEECKALAGDAPAIARKSRFGSKKIKWSQVDMGETKVSIMAASTLSKTPAGREQTVIEWAQAGIVSQDEARRLLRHPDLERSMSLYDAAIEDVECCLEEIADGEMLVPEPFQNMSMIVWRGQMQYLGWKNDGAPEEILENLRQFIIHAAFIVANQNAPQGAPAVTGMTPPPPMAPPQSAVAAQTYSPMAA